MLKSGYLKRHTIKDSKKGARKFRASFTFVLYRLSLKHKKMSLVLIDKCIVA